MALTARQRSFFAHQKRRQAFASDMRHRDRVGSVAGLSSEELESYDDVIRNSKEARCTARGYMCIPCGEREPGNFRTYVDGGTRCVSCQKDIGAKP